MRFIASVLVASVMGGSCATPSPTVRPVSLTPKQTEAAKTAIVRELRDPESARFGPMVAARDKSGLTVCGWVNSKNAFGGYVGERGVAAVLEERRDGAMAPTIVRVQGDGVLTDASLMVQLLCSKAGLGLPPRY